MDARPYFRRLRPARSRSDHRRPPRSRPARFPYPLRYYRVAPPPVHFSRRRARDSPRVRSSPQSRTRAPSSPRRRPAPGAPADITPGGASGHDPAAGGQCVRPSGQFHPQAPWQWPAVARTDPEEDGIVLQHQLRRRARARRTRSPLDRRARLHPRTDLYFAPGQYNPQTSQGQQLLGHELTHVVQQRAGRVRNPLGSGVAVVQDPALEAEAERMGQRAAAATTRFRRSRPAVDRSAHLRPGRFPGRPPSQRKGRSCQPGPARGSVPSGSKAVLPIQPKTLGPRIPGAVARSSFVIQRVRWNDLSHSQNGLYGVNEAAPTKLYGQLAAPDPQPVGLYHRTQEDDTSNGLASLARPKVKAWEANVRFFNKPINGPDGRPIPGRRVDVPSSIDNLDAGGRRAVTNRLNWDSDAAINERGPLNGIGATLGVVGINDCASFAGLLQKLIFQANGNAHVDRADVRFDQGDYVDLPVAGIGDFILQEFGRVQLPVCTV